MTHTPDECTDRNCHDLACKLAEWRARGLQVSPAATPNRRNQIPPRTPNNSWERGIAKDARGMPLLDADYRPLGIKKYGENRHQIEESRRASQAKET